MAKIQVFNLISQQTFEMDEGKFNKLGEKTGNVRLENRGQAKDVEKADQPANQRVKNQ